MGIGRRGLGVVGLVFLRFLISVSPLFFYFSFPAGLLACLLACLFLMSDRCTEG